MADAPGKLGSILGWQFRAKHAEPVNGVVEDFKYDYYVVPPLIDDVDNLQPDIALAYSTSNSDVKDLRWFVDDVFLVKQPKAIKLKSRGSYDSSDMNRVCDALYKYFFNIIETEDSAYIREMSTLIWLNNMNYNVIFSAMVRLSENDLNKYVNIMKSLKSEYNQLQDFAQTAADVYLLPDRLYQALIN